MEKENINNNNKLRNFFLPNQFYKNDLKKMNSKKNITYTKPDIRNK